MFRFLRRLHIFLPEWLHELAFPPAPCTSISSKWIKDLNIRPETLKLAQERAGNTLEVIGIGKVFLNRTPAAQHLRERMENWTS
jgi:hypothetical protein